MSLAARLMLVLLVPTALSIAAYGYVNIRLRRAEMSAEAAREVRDHGTAIEVALDAFLRDRNLADMAELTEDLSRADRILGVLIFDAEDRTVQASRPVATMRSAYAALARRARLERRALAQTGRVGSMTIFAYAVPIGDDGSAPRGSAVVLRDLGYIDQILSAAERRVALWGGGLLLLVAAMTWLAVRGAVLRPLAALVGGVERVAGGALDVEVALARRDEMGRMASAFNHMTASLRAAREDLEAHSAANVALERRLQQAQRLALIGQLSASVAHQVGSPLNVVIGRARYALKHGGQSERDARHFHEIAAGAESISRVVEQLLSQARRVRGPVEAIDLGALARQTLRFLEAECEHTGVSASLAAEPGVVVSGRRDEIEQVILNLCVNALQAQRGGGVLAITVARTRAETGAEFASLAVCDAGPGVDAALREKIFEPFFTTRAEGGGTGLGLAICDEIVRREGGAIRVEDAPGGGACFRVTLPLRAAGATSAGGDA